MNSWNSISKRFRPLGYLHLGGEHFFNLSAFRKERITPNLFIIGAQKCGTSSLHAHLDDHPDIFMSKPLKEPGYYVPWQVIQSYYQAKNRVYNDKSDLLVHGMLKGYRGERYFGESSTFYTNGQWNITKDVWRSNNINMRDIRLIYIMKNPIDRMISHYLHVQRHTGFSDDFNTFIESKEEAITISCYGHQISTYLDYFSRDQLFLLNFESFISNPQDALYGICNFLQIRPNAVEQIYKQNVAPENQEELRRSIRINDSTYKKIRLALDVDRQLLKQFAADNLIDWDYSNRYKL